MHDFTTGSVSRHLLKTTGFMLATMAFQTLYFLVDLYWVAHLGGEAIAAVGIAGNLMFVVLALTQMLGVGATTLISHAVGRQDRPRALLVFNQSLVLAVVAGALFLALAGAMGAGYARRLSPDAMTARLAADYLRWFVPALALQFAMVAMAAALRGSGNFKPGMVVQTASVILNMILAPVLIFGWFTHRPLGVAGAALASFAAILGGTVWLLLYFFRREASLRLVPADWKPRLGLWGSMMKIGLPAGAEFALMGVYLFVVYSLSRPFGAAAQAGFGIGLRIVQAGFMPVVALGFAVAPVAGQNFGARQPHRVRAAFRSALLLSVCVMVPLTLIAHMAPASLVRCFSKDARVVMVGDQYLQIISWNFVASGIIFVSSSMFQALGNTIPSLVSSLARIIAVTVPATVLSRVPGFELHWIWYLSVAAVAMQMLLSLLLLRREFRLRMDEAPIPTGLPGERGRDPARPVEIAPAID